MLSLVIFLAHLFTVNPVNAQVFDAVNVSAEDNVNDSVVVGASRLDYYIKFIKNKSVAVIGNQTSMVGNVHLVDTLLSLGVDVKMVFAPEHGFRGMADAGEKVSDGKDPVSGLPIKSLY